MMHPIKKLSRPISLLFMVMIINSSASIGATPGQDVYYTTPPVTFIHKFPDYNSHDVAKVYRGESVIILSREADDWCLVQTVQGQQVGWIQRQLLSTVPIPTRIDFTQHFEVALQDTPQKEGASRKFLYRGGWRSIASLHEIDQGEYCT
jgi:hypothetical protein